MTACERTRRAGQSLTELLLALGLLATVGIGVTRMVVSQSRFFDHQNSIRSARSVSRSAVNLMLSELRVVDASAQLGDSSAIVAASPTSLTLRVPYAFGVTCSTASNVVTASLAPVEPLVWSSAGFAGYAWRDTLDDEYHFVETGASIGTGDAAACAGAGFTTLSGGKVVALTPLPAVVVVGHHPSQGYPIFLFQRLTYEFAPSATVPGELALWRRVAGTGLSEEIAAPFDASARFRFYVRDSLTAQDTVPPNAAHVRGLEIVLSGKSERPPQGRSTASIVPVTTAVFFKNRRD